MSDVRDRRTQAPAEPSTAELVQRATEQMSRLVREELQLARVELADKGKQAGVGAGLLGGGGLVALYGVAALLAALIWGLAEAMPGWLAALLVGAVLLIVAGLMAMVGRGRVKDVRSPLPEEAMRSVRRDVDTVTSAVKERGR